MGKRLLIGLGTGRCGTLSLATVLDAQYQASVTHEFNWRLPWIPITSYLNIQLTSIFNLQVGEQVGDVGFYYLPYAEKIINTYPDSRLICLKRDMDDTTASQMRAGESLHHMHVVDEGSKYFDHDKCDLSNLENRIFRNCFPKYDLPEKKAWEQYWKDYYTVAERLQSKYPTNFGIFDMEETLNTADGQNKMLEFAGTKSRFILTHIKVYKEFTGDPNQFKGE